MVLQIPKYIESAHALDETREYEWGEDDEDEVLITQPKLMQHLNTISYRGLLALAVGAVEWIAWRISPSFNDDTAFKAIQASWAGIVDWRYLKSLDVPSWEDELDDSVGAPLDLGFRLLTETFLDARRVRPVSQNVAPITEIPIKIFSKPEPYKEWRRLVIGRLSDIYPVRQEDRLGAAVPREALDTSNHYRPEMANQFLSEFLSKCDPSTNPFLSTAEEMVASGYQGVPYS